MKEQKVTSEIESKSKAMSVINALVAKLAIKLMNMKSEEKTAAKIKRKQDLYKQRHQFTRRYREFWLGNNNSNKKK